MWKKIAYDNAKANDETLHKRHHLESLIHFLTDAIRLCDIWTFCPAFKIQQEGCRFNIASHLQMPSTQGQSGSLLSVWWQSLPHLWSVDLQIVERADFPTSAPAVGLCHAGKRSTPSNLQPRNRTLALCLLDPEQRKQTHRLKHWLQCSINCLSS